MSLHELICYLLCPRTAISLIYLTTLAQFILIFVGHYFQKTLHILFYWTRLPYFSWTLNIETNMPILSCPVNGHSVYKGKFILLSILEGIRDVVLRCRGEELKNIWEEFGAKNCLIWAKLMMSKMGQLLHGIENANLFSILRISILLSSRLKTKRIR